MDLATLCRTQLLRKMRNKFFEISNFRNIVYFMNISAQTNDKILIFFQKIRPEKLYKSCMSKSQLTRVYIYPKFRFFSRKGLKTLSKKGCPIKNYSVSERRELGLSSHAFISISIFLTKTDFFEGGGP